MGHKDSFIDEEGMERNHRFQAMLERNNGGIDFEALYKGAEESAAEKAEEQRKLREAQSEAIAKRNAAINDLLNKAGESIKAENQAKAEALIKEESEKAAKEIQDRINQKLGVKVGGATDDAFKALLKAIKKD